VEDLSVAIDKGTEKERAYHLRGCVKLLAVSKIHWTEGANDLVEAVNLNPSAQNRMALAMAYHQIYIAKQREATDNVGKVLAKQYLEGAIRNYKFVLEKKPEDKQAQKSLNLLTNGKAVVSAVPRLEDYLEVQRQEDAVRLNQWREKKGLVPIGY